MSDPGGYRVALTRSGVGRESAIRLTDRGCLLPGRGGSICS